MVDRQALPREAEAPALQTWRECADTDVMNPSARAGAPVQLIQHAPSPPLSMHGIALTRLARVVAVKLQSPWPGQPGEEVALIVGVPGARSISLGRLLQARANVASFEVVSPWKAFDLRTSDRHGPGIAAEVRSVLGQSRQAGTIIDISLGGMAVEVAAKPGGREVVVVAQAGAFSAVLPCEIVHTNRVENGVTLCLKYMELTATQLAFIRNLVAAVAPARSPEAAREAS